MLSSVLQNKLQWAPLHILASLFSSCVQWRPDKMTWVLVLRLPLTYHVTLGMSHTEMTLGLPALS